jgi:molybdate transport system substrate-binding protein
MLIRISPLVGSGKKTRYVPAAGRGAQFIADGGAELGLSVISAIEHVQGVELLGPLPSELQNYVEYTAAIGAAAKEQEAGKALINFLKSPAAVPVLKANGLEPIIP